MTAQQASEDKTAANAGISAIVGMLTGVRRCLKTLRLVKVQTAG